MRVSSKAFRTDRSPSSYMGISEQAVTYFSTMWLSSIVAPIDTALGVSDGTGIKNLWDEVVLPPSGDGAAEDAALRA